MSSRRSFIKYAAASGVALSMFPAARAASRIRGVVRREETIQRYAVVGDCWHMSWAADDRQYISLCDGFGFSGQSKYLYNAKLIAVEGEPEAARFFDLPTYPLLSYYPSQKLADPRYYPFGTLALDGRIYQFMSTFNRELSRADIGTAAEGRSEGTSPMRFNGVKLIYSPDNGRTWRNQNGSTPVIWEAWDRRSTDTMLFFEEPQNTFAAISLLQMGKNYGFNRDGYVYGYAPNGHVDGTMNELVLFRVPKDRIVDRSAYHFFAGRKLDDKPRWSKDIQDRVAVHTFPRGWVNVALHPYAWIPSVVYNAPLGVYMMTTWGAGTAADGRWFDKPSYLGIWTALQPWGPWTQIYEETAWTPGGEKAARAFQPQIAPKWISPDGTSFWLVWSDVQRKGEYEEYKRMSEPLRKKSFDEFSLSDWELKYQIMRRFQPNYSFNVQRVDLLV